MKLRRFLVGIPFLLSTLVALTARDAKAVDLVDLHAHYFMAETTGFPWVGNFAEALHAQDWSSRFKTRVNAEALLNSDVKIAVVALYTHPLFFRSLLGGQRDALRYELEQVFHFLDTHRGWILARSPQDAREALAEGKRVMVLSIEGASGVLETEADIHEFIDQNGVRIVTPFHFVDTSVGGSAFMPSAQMWVNPWAALKSMFATHRDLSGVRVNAQGLKPFSKDWMQKLLDRRVWIDLSHASDASVTDLLPTLKNAGQPLLYTHTVLRSALQAERGITEVALQEVANTQGLVGLIPSDDMLRGTKVDSKLCPSACNGECHGGEVAFATQFAEMEKIVPRNEIFFGSDMDAPLTFLRPSCEAMEKQNPKGFWNYSQLPELYRFLEEKKLVTPPTSPKDPSSMTETFLRAWEKVYSKS